MADLSVTAANVQPGTDGQIVYATAGGTITAGQLLQQNTTTKLVTVADKSTAAGAQVLGVALNGASSGQTVGIQTSGTYNPGGTAVVGKVYKCGTSGGIAPEDDTAGGEFMTVFGIGITAASIKIGILVSGVAAAGAVT
jgi:hypothetical protein